MKDWQRAFVLHTRPWGETSLLLDLFSEKNGRLRVMAKGACLKRVNFKAVCQPFTPLLVRWSGYGEVKILQGAEPASLALPLSNITLYCGLYLNELLLRLLKYETIFSELFFDYLHCIQELAGIEGSPEPALRRFEIGLLDHLGYGIDFLHCADSGEEVTDTMTYNFYEGRGFFACLILNNRSFTGWQLRKFYQRDFADTGILQTAKRFTRIALKPYIGGKPLKSTELFRHFLSIKKR